MFTVVICGRPNVGKSTLFNRLTETKKAITYPVPGTTRDILEAKCLWQNKEFILVDTGGIETKIQEKLILEIQSQIDLALARANLILFLVDGKTGLDKNDFVITLKLKKIARTKKIPILIVVNKIDSKTQEELLYQFYKLGFSERMAISAQTGKGCGDLLDKIVLEVDKFPKRSLISKESEGKKPIKVGIFGRQNVGKSSLLNSLLGKTKVLVSETPGTTRDTVDTLISYQDQNIILIDTAGIKRKRKIGFGIEKFSIKKSLSMIEKCDIGLLLLDVQEGITRQDLRIASQILKNKKGLIIFINKWDIIKERVKQKSELQKRAAFFQDSLVSLSWAPIIFISAKTGENVKSIFDLILTVNKEKNKVLTQEELDDFYNSVIRRSPPPKMKLARKQPRIKEIEQERAPFPKFSLVVGPKEIIPPFYFRFLEKELRKKFGFFGTPIEIITRNA
ncbi:MAG: ribosome biogenesis GTPase Der [Patescibacteria group bacterium]